MTLNKLIVIRHALSGGNRENRVQGQSESELRRGYKGQTERLTDKIVEQERLIPKTTPVYVFCSDSDRAYYTAQWIHSHLSNQHHIQADLRRTELLKERGQGILERLSYEDVATILRQILPPGTNITPDAKSIYPHLFSSNAIPEGEKLEKAKSRLERFAVEDLQRLEEGTGIIVGHGISGNYLINLLKYGNILGDGKYQHLLNLAGVKLERESFGRYKEIGRYEPPNGNRNHNGGHATTPLEKRVAS